MKKHTKKRPVIYANSWEYNDPDGLCIPGWLKVVLIAIGIIVLFIVLLGTPDNEVYVGF